MTKKFLISFLFLIAFIILISASDKVSASTSFNYNGKTYEFSIDNLLAYNFIYLTSISDSQITFNFYSLDKPLFFVKDSNFGKNNLFFKEGCNFKNGYLVYDLSGNFIKYTGLNTVYTKTEASALTSANCMKKGDKNECVYYNFDILDEEGNVVFADTTVSHDTFFNFRHGTLDYSINLTGNDNNIVLGEYIAIFKVNSILLIYTTDEHPTYKYNNYKHYLSTKSSTRTYGYDLKTDKVILEDTLTKYSPNGLDIPFDKSQLIYSNFLLMDKINNLIFGTAGHYLGEDDMKGTASGNIASGGQTSEGNSLLNDYINSQNPNYNGSTNQGSDTISGGFNNVYNNFGFAEDVKKNVNGMVDVITNTEEAPKFQINVNSKYYKGTLTIVDLSWYAPYKEIGDNVICIFAYLGFLWRIFIRLPDIIRGAGADSYAGDMGYEIGLWNKYGMGRSSSPRSITERKQSLSAHVFRRR